MNPGSVQRTSMYKYALRARTVEPSGSCERAKGEGEKLEKRECVPLLCGVPGALGGVHAPFDRL